MSKRNTQTYHLSLSTGTADALRRIIEATGANSNADAVSKAITAYDALLLHNNIITAIAGFFGDNADAHIAEIEAKKGKSMDAMTDQELKAWQAWIEQNADKQPA